MALPLVIIYGVRNYGKVDQTPGGYFVFTRFVHLFYLPLFPVGSFLAHRSNPDVGRQIETSFRSFVIAWLRAACIIGALVLPFMANEYLRRHIGSYAVRNSLTARVAIPALAAATPLLMLGASYGLSHASRRRIEELSRMSKLPVRTLMEGIQPRQVQQDLEQLLGNALPAKRAETGNAATKEKQ
jgi:hypothetical protein